MTRNEFKEKWLSVFAKNIGKKKLKEIHIEPNGKVYGYLWHVFSFELAPRFRGVDANREYDKVQKEGAIEIQYEDCLGKVLNKQYKTTMPLSENHLTSEQIKNLKLREFIVVGKNFEWCYMTTHEDDCGCGPYFCYAKEV